MSHGLGTHTLAVVLFLGVTGLVAAPVEAYEHEIEKLGLQLADGLAGSDLKAVSVPDFTDLQGEVTQLGRFLAEEVSSALVDAQANQGRPAPRVIDRLRLDRVLAERKLESSGLMPVAELREVGRIAGVDALVTGRITPFSDTFRVRVKVLDSRTGEDLMSIDADLPRTRSLSELEKHALTVEVKPGDCGAIEIDLDGVVPRLLEIDNQEIALRGCVRVGEAVHCVLELTSRERDRNFYLFGDSRLVLPDGTQVPATRVTVGGSTATGAKSKAGEVLVEGVPMKATATFAPVSARVETIRRLELELQGDDAHFTDVPIEQP